MSTHVLDLLDAELVAAAAALPTVDRSDVSRAREIAAARTPAPPPGAETGVRVESHSCTAPDGHEVPLRVYLPEHRTTRAAVYHVHGGGFILGDLDTDHLRNLEIAREVGAVVVSVGYRLAPEWPFPIPLEDVYRGLCWAHEQGWVPVVRGISAGGCLAVGAALLARDRGGPEVSFQVLKSPVLDDRLGTESSVRFTDTPALTRSDLQLMWRMFLGDTTTVPAYAAPARADDLRGLPPTYIQVADLDPLRDEGIDFARALLVAGVPVELHLFPGTFHGSGAVRSAAVSRREADEEIAVLRRAVRDLQ